MALPSLGRFDDRSAKCATLFEGGCIGPARQRQEARLAHATQRERARFRLEYNNRLYTGLVILSLLGAVVARFALKRTAIEAASWGLFAFLQARSLSSSLRCATCVMCNTAFRIAVGFE
jgi:hypothetical protein